MIRGLDDHLDAYGDPGPVTARSCCHSYPGDPHAGDCDHGAGLSEADAYAAAQRAMDRADTYGEPW